MSLNQNVNAAGALAIDAQNLDQLRLQAKREPDKAVAGAAKQFEAMFLGMVLKSMREATPKDGLFDSEQTKLYTSMFDQQIAQQMAARGTGLADVMARQLSGNAPTAAPAAGPQNYSLAPTPGAALDALPVSTMTLASLKLDADRRPEFKMPQPDILQAPSDMTDTPDDDPLQMPSGITSMPQPAVMPPPAHEAAAAQAAKPVPFAQTRDFVNRMWTHAVDAARSIGVKPQFMVGQAALESGWGRHEIRAADGSSTHNVFGIKAGRDWKGPVVEKTTTEYMNGVAHKTTARFRSYASYSEAFQDYARVLRNNPRYANVVGQSQDAQSFAHGLQRAGYATDPAYADKLVRVINGTTMRQSLASAAPAQVLARR